MKKCRADPACNPEDVSCSWHRRMHGRLALALSAPLLFWIVGAAADAMPGERFGNDLYLGGGEIVLDTPVAGDAVIAGGRVALAGKIAGNALVAGGSIDIRSPVADDLYAAGGEVRIAAPIGGNARLAGGRVTIDRDADVAGALTVAGASVRLDGQVRGYALVTAAQVEVNGRVSGDLRVVGGELVLGPDAVVEGRLDYRGAAALEKAEGARVEGGITAPPSPEPSGGPGGLSLAWIVGAIVAAAIVIAMMPTGARRVTQALRARPIAAVLLGLALLVGLPIASVLLVITVIGIPLGALILATLLALVVLGYLAAAAAIGDAIVERRHAAGTGRRIIATAVALVMLAVLAQLPYVGWAVWLLALLAGSGAIALAVFARKRGLQLPRAA